MRSTLLLLLAAIASAKPAPKPPAGYVSMTVLGVYETRDGAAVILTDDGEKRFVPIFIGGTEGLSIQLRLNKRKHVRPLTHDLLDSILQKFGAELVKVQVDDMREETFIGS